MRQEASPDRAAFNRLGGQRRLRGLHVLACLFAVAAQVRGPGELAVVKRRRPIVQACGNVFADANALVTTARARLLRVGEVEHFAFARQVAAAWPPAVAALHRDRFLRGFGGRWRFHWFRGGDAVKEGRPFEALGAAAEGHPHQVVDVGLLLVDGGPELRDGRQEFAEHLLAGG